MNAIKTVESSVGYVDYQLDKIKEYIDKNDKKSALKEIHHLKSAVKILEDNLKK